MVFKRREKLGFWRKARAILSPQKGWSRGIRYISKRMQRLPDTPHRIALGFACGAMASFTPFFTLHALVAGLFAWVVRGNILAGVFGTIIGNPITFGLIAYTCMNMGNWLLGRIGAGTDIDMLTFAYVWEQPFEFLHLIFIPYLIGGIVPGLICSVICYVLLRPAINRFQQRRRKILAGRARSLAAKTTSLIESQRLQADRSDDDHGNGSGGAKRGLRARQMSDPLPFAASGDDDSPVSLRRNLLGRGAMLPQNLRTTL
jgi:uncharacterized protein (DUF2062 family)